MNYHKNFPIITITAIIIIIIIFLLIINISCYYQCNDIYNINHIITITIVTTECARLLLFPPAAA